MFHDSLWPGRLACWILIVIIGLCVGIGLFVLLLMGAWPYLFCLALAPFAFLWSIHKRLLWAGNFWAMALALGFSQGVGFFGVLGLLIVSFDGYC